MRFQDYPFDPSLQEGISSFGFEEPTDIQKASIPLILEGKDMIGCAQTGTGKTWAYALPVIQQVLSRKDRGRHPSVLILAPTRELAIQIDQQFEGLTYYTDVSSMAIYGGGDATEFEQQKQAILKGADILIATPGRLLAHIKLGYTHLEKIAVLILDEADRMLDMGFKEDIMRIIGQLTKERQTLLFSATMAKDIRQFARKIMQEPEEINFEVSKPAEGVMQAVYITHERKKLSVLTDLLKDQELDHVLIFSATKKSVKELEREFKRMNFPVQAIHSDLTQPERNEILRQFKNKKLPILVATDVISRGIDIDDIDVVINFNVPHDPEDYVHRVGRTARAKKSGVAITLVSPDELYRLKKIERLIGYTIYRMPGSEEEKEPERKPRRGPERGGKRHKYKGRSNKAKGRRH